MWVTEQPHCEGSESESSLIQNHHGLRREKGEMAAHWLETELLEKGNASSSEPSSLLLIRWTLRCPQGSIKNKICPFLSCSPPSTISGNPGSLALCLLTQLKGKGWRGDITYPVHSWAQVARDPSFRILKEAPAPFDSDRAEMDGWVSWGEPVIFELLEDPDRHREDLPRRRRNVCPCATVKYGEASI